MSKAGAFFENMEYTDQRICDLVGALKRGEPVPLDPELFILVVERMFAGEALIQLVATRLTRIRSDNFGE